MLYKSADTHSILKTKLHTILLRNKRKIKLEISKRNYPDTYENKDFYGLTLPVLSRDCQFSHKLCAISDRKQVVSRDLFDANFMFKKNFPIKEEIIKLRTGKKLKEYLAFLVDFLPKMISK